MKMQRNRGIRVNLGRLKRRSIQRSEEIKLPDVC
jgi:hypothetical protein